MSTEILSLSFVAVVPGRRSPEACVTSHSSREILTLDDGRPPSCVDRILPRNVHKALGLLQRDSNDDDDGTDAVPFPAWELMDIAAVPQHRLPEYDACVLGHGAAACGHNHVR